MKLVCETTLPWICAKISALAMVIGFFSSFFFSSARSFLSGLLERRTFRLCIIKPLLRLYFKHCLIILNNLRLHIIIIFLYQAIITSLRLPSEFLHHVYCGSKSIVRLLAATISSSLSFGSIVGVVVSSQHKRFIQKDIACGMLLAFTLLYVQSMLQMKQLTLRFVEEICCAYISIVVFKSSIRMSKREGGSENKMKKKKKNQLK